MKETVDLYFFGGINECVVSSFSKVGPMDNARYVCSVDLWDIYDVDGVFYAIDG